MVASVPLHGASFTLSPAPLSVSTPRVAPLPAASFISRPRHGGLQERPPSGGISTRARSVVLKLRVFLLPIITLVLVLVFKSPRVLLLDTTSAHSGILRRSKFVWKTPVGSRRSPGRTLPTS